MDFLSLLSLCLNKKVELCIRFCNSCRRFLETRRHSFLFLHLSGSKFLVVMPACTRPIHVFIGRPLSLLSCGIHYIIDFILSSGILFTWPYHCSLFCCIICMMSGFPFTPIVSFMCSFFILSLFDFLADVLTMYGMYLFRYKNRPVGR